MEDIGVREEPGHCACLDQLAADEAVAALERPVRLGVELVALEDDEPCVDALPPQCLHVLPRDAGGVHRAVRYSESHSTWSKYRSARRVGRMREASSPSSSSVISPSACLIPSHGRLRS